MKLVFIFGDAAVGKMTVGQELIKITDLRLFYNHMTIEPVLEIFGSGTTPPLTGCAGWCWRSLPRPTWRALSSP